MQKKKLVNCTPLQNDSTLPTLSFLTDSRLDRIPFSHDDILLLIRNIDQNKSSGPDGISARMLAICDDSVVVPLEILFRNILSSGVYGNRLTSLQYTRKVLNK